MEILKDKIRKFLTLEPTFTGDGYGSGSGSGSGSGHGSGSGDGYGHGYGSGDGHDLKSFNNHEVHIIDSLETIITSVKGDLAKGFIIQSDLQLKPCYIARYGNFFAHGDSVKIAWQEAQEKALETLPLESRIDSFVDEFNNTDKYSASKFYTWHKILTGSCTTGRDSFLRDKDIKIETDEFTVSEFIHLTKDSYNGNVIKQLAKKYN